MYAGFIVYRTMCGSAVQARAHGVTPVTIMSLSEPCVALTSAVIVAPVSLVCPVASDSCKGTVDDIQEHCTQGTTLGGGEWEYKSAVDAKHGRSVGIREAIHASAIPTRGGSNYFRGVQIFLKYEIRGVQIFRNNWTGGIQSGGVQIFHDRPTQLAY